jgi:predicted O-methyltransferase YrrM
MLGSMDPVDDFVARTLLPADPALEAAARAAADAGLPAIEVTPPQGRLLELLVRLRGARRVLEVGTLGGYSTLWMARGLPEDGVLDTIEVDPRHAEVARTSLATDPRIVMHVGDALDVLAGLDGPYDLVFVDADKARTPDYVAWALDHAAPGALIVADNVVRGGALADLQDTSGGAVGGRRLHELLAGDERVVATTIQTTGAKGHDGFTLALLTG